MNKELITGAVGTCVSAIGTVTQTNDILQTVSIVITIIGAVISMIIVPVLSWYLKAKSDGKITTDEAKEGLDTLKEGVNKVKEIKDTEEKKEVK